MKTLITKLRQEHHLDAEEYKALLLCRDADALKYLREQAREVALGQFGNRVFIRGLIEISNRCRNNCYYCGIRKENQDVARYELTQEDILDCCREGYTLGFRTLYCKEAKHRLQKMLGRLKQSLPSDRSFRIVP